MRLVVYLIKQVTDNEVFENFRDIVIAFPSNK